jgi:predicted protein tyrosine phosphatase
VKRYLFVCSQNKLRSPTAEDIFSRRGDVEVASAGTNNDAIVPLTPELVEWADIIVVMEKMHRSKVQTKYRRWLNGKRIICLDIPDAYEFMGEDLVRLLKVKMSGFLPVAPH